MSQIPKVSTMSRELVDEWPSQRPLGLEASEMCLLQDDDAASKAALMRAVGIAVRRRLRGRPASVVAVPIRHRPPWLPPEVAALDCLAFGRRHAEQHSVQTLREQCAQLTAQFNISVVYDAPCDPKPKSIAARARRWNSDVLIVTSRQTRFAQGLGYRHLLRHLAALSDTIVVDESGRAGAS